ncbi:hypothetical protein DH2020_043416 [Rehmannia glutinosa]|uniref:PHD-type zinc finger plants domain-containing protein n=1 Tax=Rehmannia glutinosa TaxID=99300 RepID=A0ABR0ULI7_REHGL
MGSNNGEEEGAPSLVGGPECCMCGDYGLSSQLFKCTHCGFRSQHKYCSNMYPEAESCQICNWCLSQKEDKTGKRNAKTSPKLSHKTTSLDHHQDDIKKNNKKRVLLLGDNHGGLKDMKKTNSDQIKKPDKFRADRPGPSDGRKRITTNHGGIDKKIIRRTRSEEISNNGGIIIKHVFRNKVRRYKLLDEVSS